MYAILCILFKGATKTWTRLHVYILASWTRNLRKRRIVKPLPNPQPLMAWQLDGQSLFCLVVCRLFRLVVFVWFCLSGFVCLVLFAVCFCLLGLVCLVWSVLLFLFCFVSVVCLLVWLFGFGGWLGWFCFFGFLCLVLFVLFCFVWFGLFCFGYVCFLCLLLVVFVC